MVTESRPSDSSYRLGEGLPLAGSSFALTENHVVNIDAGEDDGHVRYHFLSILDYL